MKIDINGITLNYTKIGKGNPLILLHGNGENYHIFDKLIERLKPFFTIYAIDSRNHGESSKTEDYSYETMAEDIFQFIYTEQLKNISIIGFSDGAIISLLLALKQNDLFMRMVLLGVNLKPQDFRKEIYDSIMAEYNETNDHLLKMMLEQPNIEIESLSCLSVNTLIIAGEYDLFDDGTYSKMVKIMPNATMKIMNGHDHSNYIIDKDILYPDLKEFLLDM